MPNKYTLIDPSDPASLPLGEYMTDEAVDTTAMELLQEDDNGIPEDHEEDGLSTSGQVIGPTDENEEELRVSDEVAENIVREAFERPSAITQPMPAQIHLINGKRFDVDEVNAWGFIEPGVFATGRFHGYTGNVHILVPYERIDYYVLDYDALERYMKKQEARAKLLLPDGVGD